MRRIKILFEDFWPGFDVKNNFIVNLLSKEYEIINDSNPDYLFFSVYGYNHLKYRNCIKIFYSGENIEPDFNLCDYAIAFQHLHAEDRYFRYPLFIESGYELLKNKSFDAKEVLNRKFCNFVYTNKKWADPYRKEFFYRLSKYKQIDSGGQYLNNIGGPVTNKIDFIKNYKFTIAFENSALSGYITEKIVDPMTVNSLPIYWGNPDVHLDFKKDSFVFVNDFETIDAAVEEIIRLDKDDNAFIEKLSKPWYTGEDYSSLQSKLLLFLKNIFEQDFNKAKRTTDYGFVRTYRKKQEVMGKLSKGKIMTLSLFNKEFQLLASTKIQ